MCHLCVEVHWMFVVGDKVHDHVSFLLTMLLQLVRQCYQYVCDGIRIQVAQLSQTDRAAVWFSCGPNINVVFRIQTILL